jgi:hypothetical protein
VHLTGAGTVTVRASQAGDANYNAAPDVDQSFTVAPGQQATALVLTTPANVQYSDAVTLKATVSPAESDLTGSVEFFINGNSVGSAPVTVNGSSAVATKSVPITLAAGTYNVTAVFTSPDPDYPTCSGGPVKLKVTPEDVFVDFTGDTIGQEGTSLTLRATVWDSAANGYKGANPETGASATVGDITKIWVEFDIYPAGNFRSGRPGRLFAQVFDTGTAGDGIGTATATYKSMSEGAYGVTAKVVSGPSGTANLYYTPVTDNGSITFYEDIDRFVNGSGHITDATASKGVFAFNGRFIHNNQLQGQFVYTWRGP